MSIAVLHRNNFRTPIRPLTGFTGRAMLARIRDELHTPRTVLVFAYPRDSRGMANMLTWWLCQLYAECLPTSGAWLIQVPGDALRAMWPDDSWPTMMTCWALEEIPGLAPDGLPVRQSAALEASLQRWRQLPRTIGLAEALALNHPAPVLRISALRGEYAAIDGSQIFGGEYWTLADLTRIHNSYNHLARLAGYIDSQGRPNRDAITRVRFACRRFPQRLTGLVELQRWLQLILPSADADAAIRTIATRSNLEKTRWGSARIRTNDSQA